MTLKPVKTFPYKPVSFENKGKRKAMANKVNMTKQNICTYYIQKGIMPAFDNPKARHNILLLSFKQTKTSTNVQ